MTTASTGSAAANGGPAEPRGLLFDARRCRGCQACVLACREANHHEKLSPTDRLHESAFLAIRPGQVVAADPPPAANAAAAASATASGSTPRPRFSRKACMHCADAACVSVCPVGAFSHDKDGAVRYDAAKCMGCRYCLFACPFGVPTYEWNSLAPRVRKCELCPERRAAGLDPACATVCPAGAITWGTRDTLVAEARSRITTGGYVPEIFGLEEAGGTGVLIVSDVPFAKLGLPSGLPKASIPNLTWNYLSKVPTLAGSTAVGLAGLYWIIRRRNELRAGGSTQTGAHS